MAVKLSRATGNWLTASTWGVVDSTSYNNSESTSTNLTTSYQASSGSTTGAITVDGVALKLSTRTGTTGTMSVHLAVAGVEVSGTLVTIDVADLPDALAADLNGGWIFFKFSSPVTLSAATSYTVEAKTSNSSQVALRSTSGTNWARALVTTTNSAPTTGDDVIICGEYLSAGSSNSFTVTMDETASTDYGANSTSLVTPAIAICNKGILTYGSSSSTNYNLKVSGNLIVYSGGDFSIGTTGTPIPRDSTATLLFDCGSSGAFGLTVRNLGTFNSQGLSRTSGKDIVSCYLNGDVSANGTSLSVDTDTGWLDNDEIAIASTSRTSTGCENGTLNGNAGASTITVDGFTGTAGGVLVAHSGTAPTQAEVILLTRNIVIQGASSSNPSFVMLYNATVDCDWTAFKWLGNGNSTKRGIETTCTNDTQSLEYCCIRNFESTSAYGFYVNTSSGSGITFSNNVTYRTGQIAFKNVSSTGTCVVNNNVFMHNLVTGSPFIDLEDIGITFTNNKVVGARTNGLNLSENAPLGTFSDNVIHSCGNIGLFIEGGVLGGTFTNTSVWRCLGNSGGSGMQIGQTVDLHFDGFTLFGNTPSNIAFNGSVFNSTFTNLVSNGDSSFSTADGMSTNSSVVASCVDISIIDGDFSSVSGIKTAHTNDLNIGTSSALSVKLYNTKLGGTNEFVGQSSLSEKGYVASQKHDQTSGNHKTWKKFGILSNNTVTVHSGANSLKMSPNNASNKLESSGLYGGFQVAIESGNTCTPTVYVYEDGSYNGNRARLILKKNDALGITSDVVLDTATAASDAAWEALTGTTGAASDDGVMEFVVDCDGTAGNLYVDSFSVV